MSLPFHERLLCSPNVGFAAINVGRTKGYELINRGVIKIVKEGKKTSLVVESLKQYANQARGENSGAPPKSESASKEVA